MGGLSIGDVTRRTGLSPHALRLYEREGLLVDDVARVSGRRVYSDGDVEWLEVCVYLRQSGMPLDQIRRYAALVRDGDGSEAQRLAMLRAHREAMIDRLHEIGRGFDLISEKIRCYEEAIAGGQ